MPSPQHEEVVAFIRAMAAKRGEEADPVAAARERLDLNGDHFALPAGVAVSQAVIGGVGCERYEPVGGSATTVLYFHGGGYVAGSLRSHRPLCARIAEASGATVIAVDYRLAPEHPHPAALDDVTAVYLGLVDSAQQAGRTVVAGDSAGAGLAVALVVRLQDTGAAPLPAAGVLISPWLDLTLTSDAVTRVADADPMLDADTLRADAEMYAGTDLRAPLVSPVFAPDDALAALPPLLVLAGGADILVDDSRTFAARASAVSAPIELDLQEGLVHVWPFLDGVPEAAAALDRIGAWVRDHSTG